jgi:hypothetical protein
MQVSPESYRAVLAGTLTLREAKAMGRDGAPATDAAEDSGGPGTATETPRGAGTDTGAGIVRRASAGVSRPRWARDHALSKVTMRGSTASSSATS